MDYKWDKGINESHLRAEKKKRWRKQKKGREKNRREQILEIIYSPHPSMTAIVLATWVYWTPRQMELFQIIVSRYSFYKEIKILES